MLRDILLAFIPIFVAVDAVGVLPIFVSLTDGLPGAEKRRIILQSMITAVCLALCFIFLGKAIFTFMGITISDFMIAGGIVLFGIAVMNILGPGKERLYDGSVLGAVPLGTPLIVGPGVLSTSLIIIEQFGVAATIISVMANILLAGLIFLISGAIIRFLGAAGTKALSKVMSLFLGAIAVMMIRKGLELILKS
jgi:multiple antibiotic resistance protein